MFFETPQYTYATPTFINEALNLYNTAAFSNYYSEYSTSLLLLG